MNKLILFSGLFIYILLFNNVSAWSDGFDDGDITDWTLYTGAGSVAASTDRFTNGTHSIKLFDNSGLDRSNASILLPYSVTNFNYSANVYFVAGGTQRLNIRLLNESNNNDFTAIIFNAGQIRFANGSNYPNTFQATTYNSGEWYNVNLYYNKGTYRCYVNGTEYCESTGTPFINDSVLNRVLLDTGVGSLLMTTYVDQMEVQDLGFNNILTVTARNSVSGLTINNFSSSLFYNNGTNLFNGSTTNGTIIFNMNNQPLNNYSLLFISDKFKNLNDTVEYLNVSINHEFNTVPAPSINITFLDELNREILFNVSYKIIFSNFSIELNSSDLNSVFIQLNNTGNLEIEYNKEGYYLRHYFVTLVEDSDVVTNLYLLNDTAPNNQLIEYSITDQDGNIIPDAIIKALRRYIIDDQAVFEVVEMSRANFNGEGGLHLELFDATYKFFSEFNGVLISQTDETTLYSNVIGLSSDLSTSVITSSIATTELNVTFIYDELTLNLTTNYNDPTGITTQLCVTIEQIGRAITEVNSGCNLGSAGSLVLGVPNSSGSYRAYAKQFTNTEFSEKPAGVFSIVISDVKEIIGVSGIFYLLMFMVTGALLGMAVFGSAQHTIGLATVGFIIGILFKITEFGWTAGISVVAISGFLIYIVKQKGVIG